MYIVYFYEERNLLLQQLRKGIPFEGEELKIKGRKAKVLKIEINENKVHVYVLVEKVIKKAASDTTKKKRK
ncbi:hypothetical protein FZC84_10800 [Rossellomorea vietnamensis]|uniref:Uncharacterized protein n=1 Tax=Rossellomorea vietnamensis TaxID=218284 RepID=A0A5D4MBA9_9BACI|nr:MULTISPECIES: hypothetical protein [Bacillaceae]TYR99239.1 hypothetical protein FZC84_10800 [Rossellomorea vietnamensis]